jgi:hypothetical protein
MVKETLLHRMRLIWTVCFWANAAWAYFARHHCLSALLFAAAPTGVWYITDYGLRYLRSIAKKPS